MEQERSLGAWPSLGDVPSKPLAMTEEQEPVLPAVQHQDGDGGQRMYSITN